MIGPLCKFESSARATGEMVGMTGRWDSVCLGGSGRGCDEQTGQRRRPCRFVLYIFRGGVS